MRNEDKSFEGIAKEFGVTRERIRQIEARALRKIYHGYTSFLFNREAFFDYLRLRQSIEKEKMDMKEYLISINNEEWCSTDIETLDIPTRLKNALRKEGVFNISQLVNLYIRTDGTFNRIRNIGSASVKELKIIVSELRKNKK